MKTILNDKNIFSNYFFAMIAVFISFFANKSMFVNLKIYNIVSILLYLNSIVILILFSKIFFKNRYMEVFSGILTLFIGVNIGNKDKYFLFLSMAMAFILYLMVKNYDDDEQDLIMKIIPAIGSVCSIIFLVLSNFFVLSKFYFLGFAVFIFFILIIILIKVEPGVVQGLEEVQDDEII